MPTVAATRLRLADVLAEYEWMWNAEGCKVSIDPDGCYAVAFEANNRKTTGAAVR